MNKRVKRKNGRVKNRMRASRGGGLFLVGPGVQYRRMPLCSRKCEEFCANPFRIACNALSVAGDDVAAKSSGGLKST